MKNLFPTIIILILSIFSSNIYAHKVGNGGDYLRANFISMGKSALDYLNETPEGQKLLQENNLNISELDATLDINRIQVVDTILKDNTGSVVDALGIPSLITLNSSIWYDHFENARDVYYLVFHEMLRSNSVDDDNYRISAALKDFPLSKRIETRLTPLIPLTEQDRLSGIFNNKTITIGGSGCSNNDLEVISELNEEKNIFQISMKNFRVNLEGSKRSEIKSCAIAIPLKVPAKKRVVISLIDIGGEFDFQPKTSGKLSFEAFLSGNRNAILEKVLGNESGQKNSFLMRKTDVLKSTCGGNDIMRINSNLISKSLSTKNEYSTVKSISIYLALEDCKK